MMVPLVKDQKVLYILESNKICYISDWPAQSPDLNIIENLWSILKCRISKFNPFSTDHVCKICQFKWLKISEHDIERLYESIPRRISSLLNAKGINTKY